MILLRPTKSLVLHLQQIGRGMRPAPGKKVLIVLDHAGNTLRHGLPDIERNWSLDGVDKQGEERGRRCPECGAVNTIGADCCSECGFEFERTGRGRREPDQIDGELAELTSEQIEAIAALPYRVVMRSRVSAAELVAYARRHGYRPGWVWYRLRDQQAPS